MRLVAGDRAGAEPGADGRILGADLRGRRDGDGREGCVCAGVRVDECGVCGGVDGGAVGGRVGGGEHGVGRVGWWVGCGVCGVCGAGSVVHWWEEAAGGRRRT